MHLLLEFHLTLSSWTHLQFQLAKNVWLHLINA